MHNLLYSLTVILLFRVINSTSSTCSTSPPSPYKLSVCTMIHNEAKYIEEWLAYHMLLKVDHFFIYNDRSTDNIQQILAPYIKMGVVTLLPWGPQNKTISFSLDPHPSFTLSQRYAIADCLYNRANKSEWFGVWDVDEFLVLNSFFPDMHAFMPFAKANADDYLIPMTIFGDSGHSSTPNRLVIQDYNNRANITLFGYNPYNEKFSGKSMYKSGCGKPEVHTSNNLNKGCRKYEGWIAADGSYAMLPLSIHHYAVKSWPHFEQKLKKWKLDLGRTEFEKYAEFGNRVYDIRMEKYVAPVQKLMECMRNY